MPNFPPISPKLKKGCIVTVDQQGSKLTSIEFQYNPDTLTRRLTPKMASSGSDRNEALRLLGPPDETISFEIEIDATDQLEVVQDKNDTVIQQGIYAMLAALEVLLYPDSKTVTKNDKDASQGVIEIIPLEAPLTLLVWGEKEKGRIWPVRLTSFSITEEAFDPRLNPIRAKVSLEMQVLTYYDLGFSSVGGQRFLTYHQNKEQAAKQNKSGNCEI